VKLKRFESLMANKGLNWRNPKPMTKMKKTLKSRAKNEVC
jgi:hypothetical protein